MNNIRLALLPIAAALVLAACGNKGPLVLPDKPAASAAPAGQAGPVSETPPATTETPPEAPTEPLPLDNDD